MKTKTGVSGILMGAMLLSAVFGALVFGPQVLENARAFEPSYLEFMMPDDDTLAIYTEDGEAEISVDSKDDGGGFSVVRTNLLTTTSNPTGYKIIASATGKDHDGNFTEKLVFDHPRAIATIPSLAENVAIVKLKDDGESELWNASDFPKNHWGIGIDSSEPIHIFRPISVDGTKIKTTDGPAKDDETTVLIGIKVDQETPPGTYSNVIEFTALANPVPYIYMLEYDTKGGAELDADIITVFNQMPYDMLVTDAIPTRADHASGGWTFLGWSDDSDASVVNIAPHSSVTMSTDDSSTQAARTVLKRLYAVWQKDYNYALVFEKGTDDPVDDLPETLTATSNTDASFTIPEDIPTRRGYNFSGWTDGDNEYQPGETYIIPTTAEGENPITRSLVAKWTPKNYVISITNSLTSTDGVSKITVPYDGSRTVSVKPEEGHYLSEVSCPDGYTCSGYEVGADETGAQTVTIINNKTMSGGTVGFSGTVSEYEVAIIPSLKATTSTNSLAVPYGDSRTFTITPEEDFYLNGLDCSEGYVCTGFVNGNNATARGTQTITVTNNRKVGGGVVSFVMSSLTPLSDYTYMQDVTSKVIADTAVGYSKTLIDKRDGKSYLVAKLKDGKIWMAKDLQLGGSSDMVLTPELSDVSTNFTLKKQTTSDWCSSYDAACVNQNLMVSATSKNENLYNWYTATAGTGTYDVANGGVESSICPKGWKLPTGGPGGDFSILSVAYGGTAYNSGGQQKATANLRASPFPNITGGGYRWGSTYDRESDGSLMVSYWSRTTYDHAEAYGLYFDSGQLEPQDNNMKIAGRAVRCVAAPQVIVESFNANTDTNSFDVVPYGETRNIKVTPDKGYYLSSVVCPDKYTCSGYQTGSSYTGQQIVTIKNNNMSTARTGDIVKFSTGLLPCSSSTPIGTSCAYGSSKAESFKLKDGKFWTKHALAYVAWSNLSSVACPAGMNKPAASDLYNLSLAYGATVDSGGWSPYGTRADNADLKNATSWKQGIWATGAVSSCSCSSDPSCGCAWALEPLNNKVSAYCQSSKKSVMCWGN